jgi:indole-3-glycerol phosphate synthase
VKPLTGVLADIVAAKKRRLSAGEFAAPDASSREARGDLFRTAISAPGAQILAEIKHRSPSAGLILDGAHERIEDVARAYARGGAAALSIVIEQDFFAGDGSWIARARQASGLPVLMKDFVIAEEQLDFALAVGADAVLLIASILEGAELKSLLAASAARGLAAIVEAHSATELEEALEAGATLVGVNARDLSTFKVDLEAMARLGRSMPSHCLAIAESGIHTASDVQLLTSAGYKAFLVGESLLRSSDQTAAVRRLKGEGTTEVKICGVTRIEDVELCDATGVDYVGLNFSPASVRRVGLDDASRLAASVSRARPVLVFFRNSREEIEAAARAIRPFAIQVADAPGRLPDLKVDVPVWQTFPATDEGVMLARGWKRGLPLFDAVAAGGGGGTGKAIDLSFFSRPDVPRPFALAGGLNPGNVACAIAAARPGVVDVASGVESQPGIKDAIRVRDFVAAVRRIRLEGE